MVTKKLIIANYQPVGPIGEYFLVNMVYIVLQFQNIMFNGRGAFNL